MVGHAIDRFPLPKRSVFKDLEVVRINGRAAIKYKGTLFSNLESTSPVLAKILAAPAVESKLSQDMFGPSPPGVFVGEYGYPHVSVGPLVSVDDSASADFLDSPAKWMGMDYGEIIRMRSSLVTGRRVHSARGSSRYLSDLQDAVISFKPVDVELGFESKPAFSMMFSPQSQPSGPSGQLRRFDLADNPRIPGIVDDLIEDKLLVREAVPEMLQHGLDYYYVQKLLSAGVLGKERRLVPTKWSITGADDIIGKHLLEGIRNFDVLSGYQIYSSDFLHNHFEVLLMPGSWEFENFESWAPSTPWAEQAPDIIEEHEPFEGRRGYAELQGGGYYASRLGVIEGLAAMRRQARCVVFREVAEGYIVPMGVWQVRENVRKAMRSTPRKCGSLNEALEVLSTRLRHPISEYVKRSQVLAQKRMSAWL